MPYDPGTELHRAVLANDVAAVARLLAQGTPADLLSVRGRSPALRFAARGGNAEILRLLLAAGADPNPGDGPVGTGDSTGRTALHMAVESGSLDAVVALVQAGAKLNVVEQTGMMWSWNWPRTALDVALAKKHAGIVDYLRSVGARRAPGRAVREAVDAGDCDRLRVVLEAGEAQYHEELWLDMPPLHVAAAAGRADLVGLLLRHHAPVNFIFAASEDIEEEGTALHQAAAVGSLEVVRALVEAGARVNAIQIRDGGGPGREETALDIAEAAGSVELADALRGMGGLRRAELPALNPLTRAGL